MDASAQDGGEIFEATAFLGYFEDLTDTRQTRFGPVVVPPVTNPTFNEIYAPLEGFMMNVAVKVRIL